MLRQEVKAAYCLHAAAKGEQWEEVGACDLSKLVLTYEFILKRRLIHAAAIWEEDYSEEQVDTRSRREAKTLLGLMKRLNEVNYPRHETGSAAYQGCQLC